MTGAEFLEKLLRFYQSAYDIIRHYEIHGSVYDAYAAFNVTSAKYVLIKKAELWRANCYEHTLFSCRPMLDIEDLRGLRTQIQDYIEPEIVRQGRDCMEKDHMYTYITVVYICEKGVTKEIRKQIRRFRFFKNYKWGIRGYSQARLLVFDMENRKVLGNHAARELIKGYKRVF